MRSAQNLFGKGCLTRQPSLSDLLDAHKRAILNKISGISNLDDMTDAFVVGLVKDSLVEPLVLHLDKQGYVLRTEQIDGSLFPGEFVVERGRRYPQQVARISIPFSGDRKLLEHTPDGACTRFPHGEVSGHTIHFDVIMWGGDGGSRAKEEVENNRKLLESYAANVNRQIKAFNEALATEVKAAFEKKLDELTKQHAVLADLGIPEGPEPEPLPHGPAAMQPKKKGRARAVQITQIIGTVYVERFNQVNKNLGDVNNAVQAG
jgi:hypothetical protein